jgi:hypothetical protein
LGIDANCHGIPEYSKAASGPMSRLQMRIGQQAMKASNDWLHEQTSLARAGGRGLGYESNPVAAGSASSVETTCSAQAIRGDLSSGT